MKIKILCTFFLGFHIRDGSFILAEIALPDYASVTRCSEE